MPEEYSKTTEELLDDIRKLLNLKRTEFIVDPDLKDSFCDPYSGDGITRCYLKRPEDAIHEGIHAFFEERSQRLWEELGEDVYKSKIEYIVTDEHLEELSARLIEVNSQNIVLNICSEDFQKTTRFIAVKSSHYEDIELGKKIMRLYASMYDFYCVCPLDIEFYNDVRNDIDPMIIYNKLARYVGAFELI